MICSSVNTLYQLISFNRQLFLLFHVWSLNKSFFWKIHHWFSFNCSWKFWVLNRNYLRSIEIKVVSLIKGLFKILKAYQYCCDIIKCSFDYSFFKNSISHFSQCFMICIWFMISKCRPCKIYYFLIRQSIKNSITC